MTRISDVGALSLLELTTRGLTAHLQEAVLDQIIEDQMEEFHERVRAELEKYVRSITLGHVKCVRDVLKLRDELTIKIDVDFKDNQLFPAPPAGASA